MSGSGRVRDCEFGLWSGSGFKMRPVYNSDSAAMDTTSEQEYNYFTAGNRRPSTPYSNNQGPSFNEDG